MRKFLLMLTALLVSAAPFAPVSAYWTIGDDRLQPSDVHAGQTIVLYAASAVEAPGYLGNLALVQQHLDDCLYEVVDAGTNAYVNRPQFYLRQKTTGKYIGSLVGRSGSSNGYVNSTDSAYAFCVFSCYYDEEGPDSTLTKVFACSENNHWTEGWDELSVTLPFNITEDYLTVKPWFLGNGSDYGPTYVTFNNTYTSPRAWNLYEATYVDDPNEDLAAYYEYMTEQGYTENSYIAGTWPGYYDATAAAEYTAALQAVSSSIEGDVTSAQAKQLISNLDAAIAKVDTLQVPITEGYYRIISACNQLDSADVKYAMYSTNSTGSAMGVNWDTLDVKNAQYIYYIAPRAAGNWSIRNMRWGVYFNTPGRLPAQESNESDCYAQIFTKLSRAGQWQITNSGYTTNRLYPNDYSTAGEGYVNYATSVGSDNRVAWYLQPVTDQALLDSLTQAAYNEDINEDLKQATMDAQATLDNTANVYEPDMDTPLVAYASSTGDDVTDRLIVSSIDNTMPKSGNTARTAAAMIDNNTATYWHTQWAKSNLDKNPKNNFIIAKLQDPVQQFVFRMQTRQDNNFNNWVIDAIIYGTNDDVDTTKFNTKHDNVLETANWTQVAEIGIPDIKPSKNKSAYVTSAIQMDQPYKNILFYGNRTNNGSASNGLAAMQYAEFNLFPCALNTVKSASARADMQQPIANLTAAIAKATTIYEGGGGTQADIDELQAAVNAYLAAYPDPSSLIANLKAAQTLVENAVPDNTIYGGVSQEAYDNLQQTITNIADPTDDEAIEALYPLSRAQMDSLANVLQTAVDAFNSSMKLLKDGSIVYITSTYSVTYDDGHGEPGGTYVYAGMNDTRTGLQGSGTVDAQMHGLFWGAKAEDVPSDASAMWKVIATSDTTFAFQNVASGWYISGAPESSGVNFKLTDTIGNFKVRHLGQGQFSIYSMTPVTRRYWCAQKVGYKVVAWNSSALSGQSTWSFEDVEEGAQNIEKYLNNSVNIVTLPYNTTELPSAVSGAEVSSYALVGATKGENGAVTAVTIAPLDEPVAAGTPFIMVVGDTTQNTATGVAADSVQLDMHLAELANLQLTTTSQPANGLVGVFKQTRITGDDKGYFNHTALFPVPNTNSGVVVREQTGYIEAGQIADLTSQYAFTIDIPVVGGEIVNSIKNALLPEASGQPVNIYTADGVLVAKNVKAADAVKKLNKGIYIVGGKKVLVK